MAKNGRHTIDPALPVHYLLEIYEASFTKDLVGHFDGSAPFMSFHIGELFDPRCLIGSNVEVPQGHWWKITNVVHRVWEIEQSHITHQVGICVEAVPWPK
jgi:hypothetical protein